MKMDDHNEWAKAENPEVEQAKQEFSEAQEAAAIRGHITVAAANAVLRGGVDRDWVNSRLTRLGASPVTGQAQYQINVPITGHYGTTVTAGSRTEALEKFNRYAQAVADAGQLRASHCGEGVYGVQFTDAEPVFYSGPMDYIPEGDGKVPGLDALKDGVRSLLKHGITDQGWGYTYAQSTLAELGLPPLPDVTVRPVSVPVTGIASVNVLAFEGDDDEAAQQAAESLVARSKSIVVKADEVGSAFVSREGMQMNLVDDDE